MNPKLRGMKHWIGIDVSKAKLDLALLDGSGSLVATEEIANSGKAIRDTIRRWQELHGLERGRTLACMEPTGHYSYLLLNELVGLGVPTWVAHPLDIKRSLGLVRGKNDQVDALRIAQYARRFCDKARLAGPDTLSMNKLRQLVANRRHLVKCRDRQRVRLRDMNRCMDRSLRPLFDGFCREQLRLLKRQIAEVEQAILSHIRSDGRLSALYDLLLSVDGVGPVLASYLLGCTEGFVRFPTARSLACHAGVVPYAHSSGSSIRGGSHVSPHADRQLKTLLHMSVLGLLQRPGEMQDYYVRKVAQGKSPMCVINALRCKLVHRIFAVVRDNRPFERRLATAA